MPAVGAAGADCPRGFPVLGSIGVTCCVRSKIGTWDVRSCGGTGLGLVPGTFSGAVGLGDGDCGAGVPLGGVVLSFSFSGIYPPNQRVVRLV